MKKTLLIAAVVAMLASYGSYRAGVADGIHEGVQPIIDRLQSEKSAKYILWNMSKFEANDIALVEIDDVVSRALITEMENQGLMLVKVAKTK